MHDYHLTLQKIVSLSLQQLLEISEEEWNEKKQKGKWSKKELLGHLIDSAYNNHQRIIRAEQQGDLIFSGYDQDAWVIKNNYQERDISELLDLWRSTNFHIAQLVKNISENILSRKTTKHNFHQISMNTIEEGSKTNLSYLIWDYIFHVEYHLNQIIQDYKKMNPDFME